MNENLQPDQKSLTDLSVSDIKFTFDRAKSYDKQAEELVNAIATAKAVEDKKVTKELTEHKADELRYKAEARSKEAEKEKLDAEVEKQTAERQLYESVLQTFGINTHLPKWLMRMMVIVLSPIYIVLTLAVGVPFGIVKTIIDNADNVICRYETATDAVKPKLKTTVLVLLGVAVLIGVGLIVLRLVGKL